MKINREIKQVLVMRADLHCRKGKMIAQGCHASIHCMLDSVLYDIDPTKALVQWLTEGMTKIVVRVNSEEELIDIYNKARAAKLEVHLITDAGLTEFNGVPTKTCLAIGPNAAEDIDKITGELKLL